MECIVTNIPHTKVNALTTREMARMDEITWFICQKYPKWKHLHNDMEWALGEAQAREMSTSARTLIMATDGGYKPRSGISTYGWVVATNETVLATGKGPAEAHQTMANSF
jgi:hypothetical protein